MASELREYQAVRTLLEMQCANCHTKQLIDPTSQQDAESIQDWLKVQQASGVVYAYCGVHCLRKGSHNLHNTSHIFVPEFDIPVSPNEAE